MTDVQEIFNRVIDQGYYTPYDYSVMCNSLHNAMCGDVISTDEYRFARKQIGNYLLPTNCAYLRTALAQAGLPHTIEARTAIYRDWVNRPSLPLAFT